MAAVLTVRGYLTLILWRGGGFLNDFDGKTTQCGSLFDISFAQVL